MLHVPMSQKESTLGWIYLVFQLTALPSLLTQLNRSLSSPFSGTELNFLFFLINFLAVMLIFRRFFQSSWRSFRRRTWRNLGVVALGLLGYLLSLALFSRIVLQLRPGFINLNDQNIGIMAGSQFLLMAIGTVLLVPPVEECFYRGLIFGKLWGKSPVTAYLLSASVFSLIHIVGFLPVYAWPDLLLSFLQYLPAGLILAWCYRTTDTIYVPVLIHALVNLRGIWLMR